MHYNYEIVRTVIDINNRCVEQQRQFDGFGGGEGRIRYCERVISDLQSAIALIKRCIIDSSIPAIPPVPFKTHHHHQLHHQQQPSTLMVSSSVNIKFQQPEKESLLSTSSPIVMCCHPILLCVVRNTRDDDDGAFSTDDLHLISMTLLFNMGLTCHHQSITAADRSKCLMTRAMKVYELLIELCIKSTSGSSMMMMNSGVGDTENSSYGRRMMAMKRMIQMMTYNNYGQICYELGLYPHYQMCMNLIQSTLPTASDTTASSVDGWYRNIYNELRLNVFVYKLHPLPMMASAA